MSLPTQTCPACDRVFTPTPYDDCFVPACGCVGSFEEALAEGRAFCEGCGISHALRCEKMPGRSSPPPGVGSEVKVVELGGPLGDVIRPNLTVRDT